MRHGNVVQLQCGGLDHTWCPSIALDFKLIVSQLHSQAKVRDTDVTCENKYHQDLRTSHVDLHTVSKILQPGIA